jgi:transcriptional regulator with XRE-family HTH domain
VSAQEDVGARVRRLRRERGLTQQDIASDGVSASYLSLIEAGRRTPTDRALRAIADRLGITVAALLDGVDDDTRLDLELDLGNAKLLLEEGAADRAVEAFRELVDAADARTAAEARRGLARALEAAGDLEAAIAAYEELLAQPAGNGEGELPIVVALSRCYREAGDLGRAIDVGEQALARARRHHLTGTEAQLDVMLTLAMAYLERGDVVRTRQLLAEVRSGVESLGTPRARGAAYWNAAVLAGELGDKGDAVRLIERALALFGEGEDDRNLARLRNAYATLLVRDDPQQAGPAVELLRTARAQLLKAGSDVDVAYCETELSRALVLVGDPDEAVLQARSALARLDAGLRLEAARARTALAYALAAAGDADTARTEYLTAATALHVLGAGRQAALVWVELAELERAVGASDQAVEALRRALDVSGLAAPFPAPTRVRRGSD